MVWLLVLTVLVKYSVQQKEGNDNCENINTNAFKQPF